MEVEIREKGQEPSASDDSNSACRVRIHCVTPKVRSLTSMAIVLREHVREQAPMG